MKMRFSKEKYIKDAKKRNVDIEDHISWADEIDGKKVNLENNKLRCDCYYILPSWCEEV